MMRKNKSLAICLIVFMFFTLQACTLSKKINPEGILPTGETGISETTFTIIIWAGITIFLIVSWNYSLRRTIRRKTQMIKQDKERLELAMSFVNDGIWSWDLEKKMFYFDSRCYTMAGYNPSEFPGSLDEWKKRFHPEDFHSLKVILDQFLAGTTEHIDIEFRFLNKTGDYMWLRSKGKVIARNSREKPIRYLGTRSDITPRKQVEDALKASEENLRITLNSIGDAVIGVNVDGHIMQMNPAAQKLTGWSQAEAAGTPFQEVFLIADADTKSRIDHPVRQVLSSGNIVKIGNPTRLMARNGDHYHITGSGSPIRNDMGEIIGVVLVIRDVTGEFKMQAQLRQAQKMEAIGVLAGGIAHDFNNILTALIGFTELAKLKAKGHEEILRCLEHISSANLRARDLTGHILSFSRKSDLKNKPLLLAPIVKESLKFIRASLPTDIEVRQNLKTNRSRIFGNETHIHQILMNLFTNASHAMKNRGGELEVTLDSVEFNENNPSGIQHLTTGPYLQLTVSDTGCGIPQSIQNRIFEPFFTTKSPEEGTGMGLSTIYGILKEMGGHISVHSQEHVGTTFNVLIPERKRKDNHMHSLPHDSFLKGKGTVLVVDDEEPIMESTQDILSTFGYDVIGLTNSADALEKVKEDPYSFDLILTDLSMPHMNGLELSKKIRALNPNLPIILSTGFSQNLTKKRCEEIGITDLVMKPLISSELSFIVANAIRNEKR